MSSGTPCLLSKAAVVPARLLHPAKSHSSRARITERAIQVRSISSCTSQPTPHRPRIGASKFICLKTQKRVSSTTLVPSRVYIR